MKLLGKTKNKMTKDGKNLSYLELADVVLVHCNIVNNNARVSYTFVSNISFGQLLDISPNKFDIFKTF